MRVFIFAMVLASAGAYVHSVAQGSARSAPPACNLPARDATTTTQFGRRYFDGSYLKEKRVCPVLPSRL